MTDPTSLEEIAKQANEHIKNLISERKYNASMIKAKDDAAVESARICYELEQRRIAAHNAYIEKHRPRYYF